MKTFLDHCCEISRLINEEELGGRENLSEGSSNKDYMFGLLNNKKFYFKTEEERKEFLTKLVKNLKDQILEIKKVSISKSVKSPIHIHGYVIAGEEKIDFMVTPTGMSENAVTGWKAWAQADEPVGIRRSKYSAVKAHAKTTGKNQIKCLVEALKKAYSIMLKNPGREQDYQAEDGKSKYSFGSKTGTFGSKNR